jgi:hypothetical protein
VPRAASDDYTAIEVAVQRAASRHKQIRDALAQAAAYGRLLAALHDQVVAVTAERDAALIEVLAEPDHPSHRALSRDLALSRQRVDQLAAIAARGGRPRRPG